MSQYNLIGITGPAGCGKDTAADFILERLPHGYRKLSFAGPIKEMARTGLCLDTDQLYGESKDKIDPRYGVTPRRIMQTLGTEWGREHVHPDVWVKAMDAIHNTPGYDELVIPDVRFENEANYIRNNNGVLIHVNGRAANIELHMSEGGVAVQRVDLVVQNTGDLNVFYARLIELIKYL